MEHIEKYISLGKVTLNFGGESLWSNRTEPKPVEVHVVLDYAKDEDLDYERTSIMCFFDKDHWNCEEDGHIYTDKRFCEELKEFIRFHGYSDMLGYSESGMQDGKYVHFDATTCDKVRATEGNYIMDWERHNQEEQLADLKKKLAALELDKKYTLELIEALEDKLNQS